jgi:hypothetical protein
MRTLINDLLTFSRVIRKPEGWIGLPYIWNDDTTEAMLEGIGGTRDVRWIHTDGRERTLNYIIPSKNQCMSCHENQRVQQPIGLKARHLNRDYAYAAGRENQLVHWQRRRLLEGAPPPDKAPRPILINVWYPAGKVGDAKRMPHRDYLNIFSDEPRLDKFSTKLAEFNRTVIATEVMGKPPKELTDPEKRLLDHLLDTPTACVRNATPAEGKFPLVIYHSGHGSSFEDNSVLCEFLASHGFIVLGSAFQKPSGESFGVDGGHTSAHDMEFLIASARQLPGADWNHVGVIGHSGGAHAALIFRAQSHCAADAIVSLDTTQDYFSLVDDRWADMTTTVVKNRKNMIGPLLMAANPQAFFELAGVDLIDERELDEITYTRTQSGAGHRLTKFVEITRLFRGCRSEVPNPLCRTLGDPIHRSGQTLALVV